MVPGPDKSQILPRSNSNLHLISKYKSQFSNYKVTNPVTLRNSRGYHKHY